MKSLRLSDMGIATSGTYVRGRHIYDPLAADGRARGRDREPDRARAQRLRGRPFRDRGLRHGPRRASTFSSGSGASRAT